MIDMNKKLIVTLVVSGLAVAFLAGFSLQKRNSDNDIKNKVAVEKVEEFKTQIQKQAKAAKEERESVQSTLDNMLKNAKVDGYSYTMTNDSEYTFDWVQLVYTEYTKDGKPAYDSDSVSEQINGVKPGQTFTVKAFLSSGQFGTPVTLKVNSLDGAAVQN
jgi:Tfp pilus assembly protein PilX